MKIPEPKKLPSGAWNVRIQQNGKRISITKSTKKACLAAAAALKTGQASNRSARITVSGAIDAYIEARQNVLSPATIAGYRRIQKHRFQSAMSRRIEDITPVQWQRIVNNEAREVGAKTLKNAWGFLSSVIRESTGQTVTVRLPQVVAQDLPYLAPDQIPAYLTAIRGCYCEAALLLALSGLRRSELLAVRWEDIDLDAGCIRVRGAAVPDERGQLVYREENKNTTSRRTVPFLLPRLRAILEDAEPVGEYVVTCNYNNIGRASTRACREAGLPEVGLHGLRRSFASLAYHLGLSEEVTMRAGGWSDIYTMRRIYTKVSEADFLDQASRLSAFFESIPEPIKKAETETKMATKKKKP